MRRRKGNREPSQDVGHSYNEIRYLNANPRLLLQRLSARRRSLYFRRLVRRSTKGTFFPGCLSLSPLPHRCRFLLWKESRENCSTIPRRYQSRFPEKFYQRREIRWNLLRFSPLWRVFASMEFIESARMRRSAAGSLFLTETFLFLVLLSFWLYWFTVCPFPHVARLKCFLITGPKYLFALEKNVKYDCGRDRSIGRSAGAGPNKTRWMFNRKQCHEPQSKPIRCRSWDFFPPTLPPFAPFLSMWFSREKGTFCFPSIPINDQIQSANVRRCSD